MQGSSAAPAFRNVAAACVKISAATKENKNNEYKPPTPDGRVVSRRVSQKLCSHCSSSLLRFGDGSHDILELWLQRGTADQETIDVWAGGQVWRVLGVR
eukprot:TRINITY_DN7546_c0_g1_i1.p1 TRINITY_DN7546_c0_g1~~TRINITY_DN7546_c0_g1_i1.p1  ORF type:complete len:108 (+),score=4.74 TRINITY_DN7546_c0_g1_i1:29-325(+)